ncbi:hypothetical protein KP509_31G029800 [Ceratopteris richardii]|nr:hypothetical protein KP509_31G029800 [Ceratopteris richardii]KAH7288528.1 hypothetical protein KP509_31G029800 [Ceratopteris richardii]
MKATFETSMCDFKQFIYQVFGAQNHQIAELIKANFETSMCDFKQFMYQAYGAQDHQIKELIKATFETLMCDFKQLMKAMCDLKREFEELRNSLKMQVCNKGSSIRVPEQLQSLPDSCLQLEFSDDPSPKLYTSEKFKGGHVFVKDGSTGEIVKSGPSSAAKVQIVPIDGDFGEKNDEWTSEDFEKNVLKERNGKGPLLTGDLIVTLKEGIGNLGELTFTDNSRCRTSGKFRLGVKVVTESCDGITIKQGITKAFKVIENRGMVYGKHEIPCPNDEVWRLVKIHKDGVLHKRLQGKGIKTVSDFLECYEHYGQKLSIDLGIKRKDWYAILEHAKKCVSKDLGHTFHLDMSSQPVDLLQGPVQQPSTDQPAELPQETPQQPSVPPLDKTLDIGIIHSWNDSFLESNAGNAIPNDLSPNVASAASGHHDPGSLMYSEGTSGIQEKFQGASDFWECIKAYDPRPSDDHAPRYPVSATNGRQLSMQQVDCSQDVRLSHGIARPHCVPMLNDIPDFELEHNSQNGQDNHFLDGTIEENQITECNVVINSGCATPPQTSIQNHLPSSASFARLQLPSESHEPVPLTCDSISTVFQERFHEPPTDQEGYAAHGPTSKDMLSVEDMNWFEWLQEFVPLLPDPGYIGGNVCSYRRKNAVYWAAILSVVFLQKLSKGKKRRRIQF